jgi:hypothetical protein
MTGRIFINYRRGDDPGNTGRLFDRLQEAFAPDQLFMDVDNIAPGLDFVRVLEEQVAQCEVLLAVIGRGWIDARDPDGARRLDYPEDFVRLEIEAALNQGKRVIPVLVGEARMPRAAELPETIKPLARRNAVRLTHERFRADTQGLIKAIQQALNEVEILRRSQAEVLRRAQAEEELKRAEERGVEAAKVKRAADEQAQRDEVQARLKPSVELPSKRIVKSALLIAGAATLGAVVVVIWAIGPPSRLSTEQPWPLTEQPRQWAGQPPTPTEQPHQTTGLPTPPPEQPHPTTALSIPPPEQPRQTIRLPTLLTEQPRQTTGLSAQSNPRTVTTIRIQPLLRAEPSGDATSPAGSTVLPPGSYMVQLAAQRSEEEAQAAFRALQAQYPTVLGSRQPVIRRADLGDKGTFYRAQVGPFATPELANQFCGNLKVAGGQCIVQKN